MMMIPKKRNEFDLFDDFLTDSFLDRRDSKIMRTDIREKGNNYIIDVDLPGYEKEDIDIEMENGYLRVTAKTSKNVDESDEEERYIHKERYFGECSRSFYVGESLKEEDIKASFKNGKLSLIVPKEQPKQLEEKKKIQID